MLGLMSGHAVALTRFAPSCDGPQSAVIERHEVSERTAPPTVLWTYTPRYGRWHQWSEWTVNASGEIHETLVNAER